jgi:hypothetical protein
MTGRASGCCSSSVLFVDTLLYQVMQESECKCSVTCPACCWAGSLSTSISTSTSTSTTNTGTAMYVPATGPRGLSPVKSCCFGHLLTHVPHFLLSTPGTRRLECWKAGVLLQTRPFHQMARHDTIVLCLFYEQSASSFSPPRQLSRLISR